MIYPDLPTVFKAVVDGIENVDRECNTLLNDIEHGLVNIKLQFQEPARRDTGKKLTEEPLIAWLLYQKFSAIGWSAEWEVPYPDDSGKYCDLVVRVGEASRLWLELKLTWKAWFNCVGPPAYSNSAYRGYLGGRNRTHSFQQDLLKLSQPDFNLSDYRAVCMIGFDARSKPMDDDVAAVVAQFSANCVPWKLALHRSWADRRCEDFRINVWCWLHSPPG